MRTLNFLIKKPIIVVLVFMFLVSCQRNGMQKELQSIIGEKLYFGKLQNSTIHGNNVSLLSDILLRYDYVYVIYLEDNCKPCYPKFAEWQKKIVEMTIPDNFTVLFVIQGNNYEFFMHQVRELYNIDNEFCVIMDIYSEFIGVNSGIPRWIIDASILIDSEYRIRMVGVPWINDDMKELFLNKINGVE